MKQTDLQKFVDFLNSQTSNFSFENPIYRIDGGMGCHISSADYDKKAKILFVGNLQIENVVSIEYGRMIYQDNQVISIPMEMGELDNWLLAQRTQPMHRTFRTTLPDFGGFTFTVLDQAGCGYAAISTKEGEYNIYFPTNNNEKEKEVEKMTGQVKWFNNQKGFGFITGEDGNDVFVHYTGIVSESKRKELEDGQNVSYEVIDGAKGKQAVNVTVTE